MLHSEPRLQLKLHKKTRIKISEWEKQGYLTACGAELTYHPSADPSFLQAVLDLPDVRIPSVRGIELSDETIGQIPKGIIEYFESLRHENKIERSRPRDHELEFKEEDYGGLPKKEILRIDTNGSKIAFRILSMLERDRARFKDDAELVRYIYEQIRRVLDMGFELDTCNHRFRYAWHEACNPLGIWKAYSLNRGLLNEEWEFERSKTSNGLELIKARSLDCRGVCTDWKGRLFEYF